MNIIQKPCTNFKTGRDGYKPEIIVIHIMAGTLAGTDSWFANPASQVSSNYGIGLNGEIHQYVKDEDTAWAQGRVDHPSFKLYKQGVNPNAYCLSIEHEGFDLSVAPQTQLQASADLIKSLATKWNIPLDRDHVIGHYQVYSLKPNCPSTDKSVIDKLISMAGGVSPIKQAMGKLQEAMDILKAFGENVGNPS